jgi:hypothetical protein
MNKLNSIKNRLYTASVIAAMAAAIAATGAPLKW